MADSGFKGMKDKPLTQAGDALQSAASRLAEWVLDNDRGVVTPYEVHMAALEARSAVDDWTVARTATDAGEVDPTVPGMSDYDLYLNENASAFEECRALHARVTEIEAALTKIADWPWFNMSPLAAQQAREVAQHALKGGMTLTDQETAELRYIGDGMQSAASRIADWIRGTATRDGRAKDSHTVPYEVYMAALEAQDYVAQWTDARTGYAGLTEGIEAALDALLDGIDTYRATLPLDDPTRHHLRDLVDMANESRNNVRRAAPSPTETSGPDA